MKKWALGIIVFTLILAGVVYAIYQSNDYDFEDATKSYEIVNRWELPKELNEVSGIHWIQDDQIACVQDENGIIFTYNLSSSKVTNQYKFADDGDYEALSFQNNQFWVAESDGKLFSLNNLNGLGKNSEMVELEFEYRNNIEGLAAHKDGNLWLAVKERNLDNSSGYKGIYSFDPKTKKLDRKPVVKIKYDDPKFDVLKTGNPRKLIRPSDIAFSPITNELYVLDAEFPKILIIDQNGSIKELHLLDPAEFAQPEGICFSPSGRLFIANESLGGPPNITEIKIN